MARRYPPSSLWATALAFLLLLAIGTPSLNAQSLKATKVRFLREAPQAWEAYREYSVELQGKRTAVLKNWSSGTITFDSTTSEDIKQNRSSALVARESSNSRTDKDGKETSQKSRQVFGSNSKYAFTLAWLEPKNVWVLGNYSQDPQHVMPEARKPTRDLASEGVAPHFFFITTRLTDLVKDPKFSIKKVSPMEKEGRQLVRVDFQHSTTRARSSENYSGWMAFDPERSWCLLEIQMDVAFSFGIKGPWHMESVVKPGSQGHPIITRFQSTIIGNTDSKAPSRREMVIEYDLHENASVSDWDFTLSSFGLPEPHGVVWDAPPRYHVWLIGGALVALILAVFLRRKTSGKINPVVKQ